jgi:spore germination cell wall hydrolase CwlJ-like protein
MTSPINASKNNAANSHERGPLLPFEHYQKAHRRRTLIVRWSILSVLLIAISTFVLVGTGYTFTRVHQKAPPMGQMIVGEPFSFTFRPVLPADAVAINAAVPGIDGSVAAAAPFRLNPAVVGAAAMTNAQDCLTAAVYYEAASETAQGQRAVAQVVLNRMRHPAYPHSVCGVVFQGSQRSTGCQFSFTCDGSLARKPGASAWLRAEEVAAEALAGRVEPSVGTATHYHTIWVVPYWQSSLTKITTIGAHIFYKWAGGNGARAAFDQHYAGTETRPSLFGATTDLVLPDDVIAEAAAPVENAAPLAEISNVIADQLGKPEAAAPAALAEDGVERKLLADENRGQLNDH